MTLWTLPHMVQALMMKATLNSHILGVYLYGLRFGVNMQVCIFTCICVQCVYMRASMWRCVCKFSVIKDKELAGSGGLTPSQVDCGQVDFGIPAKESTSTRGLQTCSLPLPGWGGEHTQATGWSQGQRQRIKVSPSSISIIKFMWFHGEPRSQR